MLVQYDPSKYFSSCRVNVLHFLFWYINIFLKENITGFNFILIRACIITNNSTHTESSNVYIIASTVGSHHRSRISIKGVKAC